MYKLVITNGCSFSSGHHTWTGCVEEYYRELNPDCEFLHLAVVSQGNELVQKKTLRAVQQALRGFLPEEIAVFVMWTTHDRKSFYLPESSTERLAQLWSLNTGHTWYQQFADLDNRIRADRTGTGVTSLGSGAGWYHMHGSTMNSDMISKTYYTMIHDLEIGIHTTLENQLLLELFLARAGVWYQPMLIKHSIYEDILQHRDHNLVEHLWAAINWSSFITIGQADYLLTQPHSRQLFCQDGWHPNARGSKIWWQQVMLPRILAV